MQQEINLSIVDISDAAKIIKAAIERSAFKAEEMLGVATVFERLNAFVRQEQQHEEHTDDEVPTENATEVNE